MTIHRHLIAHRTATFADHWDEIGMDVIRNRYVTWFLITCVTGALGAFIAWSFGGTYFFGRWQSVLTALFVGYWIYLAICCGRSETTDTGEAIRVILPGALLLGGIWIFAVVLSSAMRGFGLFGLANEDFWWTVAYLSWLFHLCHRWRRYH